jgi:hypothetical protein
MYGSEERLSQVFAYSVIVLLVRLVRLVSIFDGWLAEVVELFVVRMML